jgi:hypothetical protein
MAKRRAGSQIANLTLDHKKSRINLIYLVAGGHATYCYKALNESYNFVVDHIMIRSLLAKLWGAKITGVPFGAISRLPLGSPRKEKPFGCRLRDQP